MRAFAIVDSSKRKAKPIAVLTWTPDGENGQGTFSLEVSSECDENRLPLSLSFCARRKFRRATPSESADWVSSRIVPENRHNIAAVLAANGLAEYDQVSLLAACKGRSSDDDLLAYEIELPERIVAALDAKSPESEGGNKQQYSQTPSTADRIIAAIKRQRTGTEIRYAYVGLDDDVCVSSEGALDMPGSIVAEPSPSAAQRIGKLIRAERRKQGLTQTQLAARAGITQTVLSRIESGAGNPTLALLEELACALDTRLDISLDTQSR